LRVVLGSVFHSIYKGAGPFLQKGRSNSEKCGRGKMESYERVASDLSTF